MPTYFDPIMQEDTLLDENTCVYLVKLSDNTFSIKGVSSGLEKLPSDPTTQATEYWPVPIKTLMGLLEDPVLFEGDKLTTKPLSLEHVIKFFDFDPNQVKPNSFNSAIKEELKNEWAEQTMRDLLRQEGAIPHTFFYRPILMREVGVNPAPQEEQNSGQLIPALAVFHMIPQSVGNEGEPTQVFLQMFIMLMNQEEAALDEQEEESAHQLH
ncbi:hypothetical protein [Legionella cincinnatiensis]|uniref:Uncharacterized protein n=1 Tax=Legionella cincinnatiensis TaxID=28085 RepID=A0A378INF6_9GAMM|nr:hypothetical protein [Legionella cincinnatiensis]KTC86195.1 hypothetical protein Lcin_1655 [Legionella cincinnatiensis]STX36480.1 Uncharacterised protein [Legionella cincinnatiensis]